MVCDRCRMAVKNTLQVLELDYENISLGEIDFGKYFDTDTDHELFQKLETSLNKLGFEVLNNRQSILIEQVKLACIQQIANADGDIKDKLSTIISNHLNKDYKYLSNLFSTVEGITIEKYFIAQRIEKVKELLLYEEHSLAEIAYQLGFSSVPHLSSQFKKLTGIPPSQFRSERLTEKRKSIDNL